MGAWTSPPGKVCRAPPPRHTSLAKLMPSHRGCRHTLLLLLLPSRWPAREEERRDGLNVSKPWLPPSAFVPVQPSLWQCRVEVASASHHLFVCMRTKQGVPPSFLGRTERTPPLPSSMVNTRWGHRVCVTFASVRDRVGSWTITGRCYVIAAALLMRVAVVACVTARTEATATRLRVCACVCSGRAVLGLGETLFVLASCLL